LHWRGGKSDGSQISSLPYSSLSPIKPCYPHRRGEAAIWVCIYTRTAAPAVRSRSTVDIPHPPLLLFSKIDGKFVRIDVLFGPST
jgi:hypothetical protein